MEIDTHCSWYLILSMFDDTYTIQNMLPNTMIQCYIPLQLLLRIFKKNQIQLFFERTIIFIKMHSNVRSKFILVLKTMLEFK